MTERKFFKKSVRKTFLRCFFAVILPLMGVFGIINDTPVFAEPVTEEVVAVDEGEAKTAEQKAAAQKEAEKKEAEEKEAEKKEAEKKEAEKKEAEKKTSDQNCYNSLGELGWLICPGTGKIANAVDWLYNKIESILQVNPIQMKDGEPIYEIWKYCRGITNIIFVIFMLVVIYSQLTGVGITNYGLKKALPKLIVAAILVNLSFLICLVLVDISNIIGMGLRGVFTTVEQTALSSMNIANMGEKMAQVHQAMAGGTALTVIAGLITFETGAIWMLIPVVLGAIVAVVSGLITIALRQAVVMLLIMISPLAMVAYILPNTEQLFVKWKKLLIRMLVFYPVFSLLFGASSLAGFAIITGAKDGFGMLLGIAVQIFPLFFSWSLMKMSGTLLGTINEKMRGLAAKPLAANRAWASSRKELSRQKHLTSSNVYTPSRYLTQFLSDRKVAREAEIAELSAATKERGLAYGVSQKYIKKGSQAVLSKEGLRAYDLQARRMKYAQDIASDKNNFNQGFDGKNGEGVVVDNEKYTKTINKLNDANVAAADMLFVEQARAEKIDHDNAKGRYERFEDAMNVHQDFEHAGKKDYKRHKMLTSFDTRDKAKERYDAISSIMAGKLDDINYAGASASASYSTQIKVVSEKYRKYFEMLPPTKDVEYRLGELTSDPHSSDYIDAITSGLRVLNQRGDTDLVSNQMETLMSGGKLKLGTHASQTLASFLMFEVKDNDPTLRRFGKYINLETARIYNHNERQRMSVDFEEFVKGGYYDENGDYYKSKKGMEQLLNGTSFDNVERTAFENYDNIIRKAYGIDKKEGDGEDKGKLAAKEEGQFEQYLKRKEAIDKSIGPAFISASTKYLSGSEQLTNAVGFKTGITNGGVDEYGIPKLERAWDKYADEGDQEALKDFYADNTKEYLAKQTPNQLLALRSDYEESLDEQLSYIAMKDEDFKNKDENKGLVEVFERTRDEYTSKRSEADAAKKIADDENRPAAEREAAMARFEDLKVEVQSRYKDFKEARFDLAGQKFREVVGDETLRQIHQSKQSGAALNAKSWVRKWTMLDGDVEKFEKELEKRMAPAGQARGLDSNVAAQIGTYQDRLYDYLGKNNLTFEHSEKDEFRQGLKDFAKSVIKDDEFEKKFERRCAEMPEAKNDTVYGEFTKLITEHFGNK